MARIIRSLHSLSRNELIRVIQQRDISISKYKTAISCKTAQIRHFRLRISKISDSLRYLLTHPFSMDNNYNSRRCQDDVNKKTNCECEQCGLKFLNIATLRIHKCKKKK